MNDRLILPQQRRWVNPSAFICSWRLTGLSREIQSLKIPDGSATVSKRLKISRPIPVPVLQGLLRKPCKPTKRLWFKVLISFAKGKTAGLIARECGTHVDNVYRILGLFRHGGMKRILKPRGNGRVGKVSPLEGHMAEIASWIGDPRSIHFFYTSGDCRKMARRIGLKWGILITAGSLYGRLRKYERSL